MHSYSDADVFEAPTQPLPRRFFARPTLEVARALIGKTLMRATGDGAAGGVIVETEAYVAAVDPAAHAYRGQTRRNRSMFGPPGHAYVYVSYGMHHCLNVVTEAEGEAAAVLIRAIEPTIGLDLMRSRRGTLISDRDLCRGPGRLCQALALTLADDGADLLGPALWIADTPGFPDNATIVATPRIGISRAAEWPWRFIIPDNPYVSGRRVRTIPAPY